MPQSSPAAQLRSRASVLSNTTYYSFQDIDPQPATTTAAAPPPPPPDDVQPEQQPEHQPRHSIKKYEPDNISISSAEMRRQDSGYESISPRDPQPSRGFRSARRESTSTTSSRPGSRARPTVRRSSRSGPVTRMSKTKLGSRSLFLTQSNPVPVRPSSYYGYPDSTSKGTSPYNPHANAQSSYFHFPPPHPQTHDPMLHITGEHEHPHPHNADAEAMPLPGPLPSAPASPTMPYDAPPQTTHYWTSDHTRRLEYAAIDAASRGVRGWLMRHMVPDCFVPKANRRVAFDDDTGSVRRYRLELDDSAESSSKDSRTEDLVGRAQKKRVSTFWT